MAAGAAPEAGPSRPTPLYELSSQFRHWRFSREGLDRTRRDLNEGAVVRVKSKLVEEQEEATPAAAAQSNVEAPPPSSRQYLTVADELALVTFYVTKISALCRASFFRFPENVEATAISYLKRFYIRNTCMDYHPKNIMLTCLFLATKTENVAISIDTFTSRIPACTPDDVLSLEFRVAQSLKFEFKVHHAHTAARGILIELQLSAFPPAEASTEQISAEDKAAWAAKWDKVQGVIRASRMTDAEFLWTPSQIATAAWMVADEAATKAWVERKAAQAETHRTELKERKAKVAAEREKENQRHKEVDTSRRAATAKGKSPALPAAEATKEEDDLTVSALLDILEPLTTLLRAGPPPIDKDLVTAVDRRLKLVRNPEKDPNSALYKKRKREEEELEEDKRKEKEIKRVEEAREDPFGPPVVLAA